MWKILLPTIRSTASDEVYADQSVLRSLQVTVQCDRMFNPEHQTRKSPKIEEVKNQFSRCVLNRGNVEICDQVD